MDIQAAPDPLLTTTTTYQDYYSTESSFVASPPLPDLGTPDIAFGWRHLQSHEEVDGSKFQELGEIRPSFERINAITEPPNGMEGEEEIGITDADSPSPSGVDINGSSGVDDILDNMRSFSTARTPNKAKDVNVAAFTTALYLNGFLFLVLVVAYEFFSRMIPSVYAGRRRHVGSDRMALDLSGGRADPNECDGGDGGGDGGGFFLGWVGPVYNTSWEHVRMTGGLDAYMFLRFIRMCLRITSVSGLWGMVVLYPVYATGGNGAEGWYYFSMANISQGSWRLWFPTIFMWLTTLYVLFLMNEEYRHYLDLRMEYLATGEVDIPAQRQYSLLVERIPHELRSDRALFDYFETLFPGKVYSSCVVIRVPELETASAKRKKVQRRLEKSIAVHEAKGYRTSHVVGQKRLLCCGIESMPIVLPCEGREGQDEDLSQYDDSRLPSRGERVDSISYYTQWIVHMNEIVAKMQEDAKKTAESGNEEVRASQWIEHILGVASETASVLSIDSSVHNSGSVVEITNSNPGGRTFLEFLSSIGFNFLFGGLQYLNRNIDDVVEGVTGATLSSTAFVTFRDLATTTLAVRAPLSHDPNILQVAVAPEPRDIKWQNSHVNLAWARGREWTANVLLGLGAILWSVPVAGIQALATVEYLETVPFLGWMSVFKSDRFYSFVNGYLPVVALLVLILILPIIFEWIAENYETRKTQSDVQKSMLARYFYYQLANVFITVSAASLWVSLADILDHPSKAFSILGTTVPTVVGYFVTFLMTKTLVGLPLAMLRLGALIRMAFLKLCFRESLLTQRELDEVYKKNMLMYGWEYPTQLLVIVICFTYACISPIILPVGAIYYLGALIVFKKQVLVVYTPIYESGGEMFPAVCHRTLIGLVCGQVALIGYVVLRKGIFQPFVLFPLPLVTVAMIKFFDHTYAEPGTHLSVEKAVELDKHEKLGDSLQFNEDLYRQPVLSEKSAEPEPYRASRPSGNDAATPDQSLFERDNLRIL